MLALRTLVFWRGVREAIPIQAAGPGWCEMEKALGGQSVVCVRDDPDGVSMSSTNMKTVQKVKSRSK